MTTATKKSALADLGELEAEAETANEKAKTAGREHHAAAMQARELEERRARLIHREPGLVDHLGNPVEDNEVAAIDRERGKLPDLGDLRARYDHATLIAKRAVEVRDAHVARNIDSILSELIPEAEARAGDVAARLEELREALRAYVQFWQRTASYYAASPERDNRKLPGLEAATAILKTVTNVGVPIPVEDRHE